MSQNGNKEVAQKPGERSSGVVQGMKQCPVCKAMVFSDMETCYACMHRFDEEQVETIELEALEQEVRKAEALAVPEKLKEPEGQIESDQNKMPTQLETESAPLNLTKEQTEQKDLALFDQFLVELHAFLGQFLIDRKIGIQ